MPIARVDKGDRAFFNGEYENALIDYQTAFQDSPDPLIQAAAKWGEARLHFTEERYEETLAALQILINEYPQSTHLGQAYFLQGLAYYRLKNYQAAADSWQTYLTLRPNVLDAYVQELRGDALYEALDYAGALSAYTAAIQADAIGDDINLDMKVAATQKQLGSYEVALARYDGITARATNDYTKAEAAYESGLAYQALGKHEEALGKFRLAIENYPLSYYSYLSLLALLEAGGQVSEIDRGLVDYFNGVYPEAIAAFDRYMTTNTDDGTAHYYRALALRDRGDYNSAVEALSTYLSNYPTHSRWVDAWGEKAFIEWYHQGAYTVAAKTLLDFVAAVPSNTTSAEYLMSAARIYERSGKSDEALQVWARVANEYPGSEQASTAVFMMGVIYYRNGDTTAALDSFNRSLTLSIPAEDKARAHLWIGKTQQKLGDSESALNAWREAQARDPGGYYSERARDLLLERAPFTPPISTNFIVDLAAERKDADSWVRLTFNLPPETDLSGLGALANDPRIIRGTELWQIGMVEDARAEFENMRAEFETNKNAEGSYRLMNYLLEIGLYRPAILAARQTLTIAGLNEHNESMMAPLYFSHIRYGLYYSDIILSDAQSNNIDPLFLYSIIRQESLFEGFVNSNMGARGLMQIIPSTGADMAAQLAWPINYDDKDLYRPDVSVAFGAHYLARNRDLLDNNLYATLAAYNAGPGSALEWKELAGDDPDLFLESARFEETRNYIRNIYEIYLIYRRLYGSAE
jgi:soluble lytic murein transglycosylase